MNRTHLTKAAIAALPVPTEDSVSYQDATVSALYLRCSATGARTWNVFKWSRAQRKPLRVSLGPYPSIGVDLARRKALEIATAIDQGRDPVAEKRETFADAYAGIAVYCLRAAVKGDGSPPSGVPAQDRMPRLP